MIDPFMFVNLLTGAVAIVFGDWLAGILLFLGAVLSQVIDLGNVPFIQFLL